MLKKIYTVKDTYTSFLFLVIGISLPIIIGRNVLFPVAVKERKNGLFAEWHWNNLPEYMGQ